MLTYKIHDLASVKAYVQVHFLQNYCMCALFILYDTHNMPCQCFGITTIKNSRRLNVSTEVPGQEESNLAETDNEKVIAHASSSACALHTALYNLCVCTEN